MSRTHSSPIRAAADDDAASTPPAGGPTPHPLRVLSFDVEEYFQIEAAAAFVERESWDSRPARVEAAVERILALLERQHAVATFFILGWVARRYPAMARRIADAGHEIASHGSGHQRIHRLSPDELREDLHASRALLQDQTGAEVAGYRAPTFSVTRQTAFAVDVISEVGFRYDSSIFPVAHHWYGVIDAPDRPFRVAASVGGAELLEIPPLTWRSPAWLGGRRLPVAGGGYFRLLPAGFMRAGLAQAASEGRPAVLYFHPWEFDPDMPRMPLSRTGMLRTYTGLRRAKARLERIIATHGPWTTMQAVADATGSAATGSAAEGSAFSLN